MTPRKLHHNADGDRVAVTESLFDEGGASRRVQAQTIHLTREEIRDLARRYPVLPSCPMCENEIPLAPPPVVLRDERTGRKYFASEKLADRLRRIGFPRK